MTDVLPICLACFIGGTLVGGMYVRMFMQAWVDEQIARLDKITPRPEVSRD